MIFNQSFQCRTQKALKHVQSQKPRENRTVSALVDCCIEKKLGTYFFFLCFGGFLCIYLENYYYYYYYYATHCCAFPTEYSDIAIVSDSKYLLRHITKYNYTKDTTSWCLIFRTYWLKWRMLTYPPCSG